MTSKTKVTPITTTKTPAPAPRVDRDVDTDLDRTDREAEKNADKKEPRRHDNGVHTLPQTPNPNGDGSITGIAVPITSRPSE